MYTKCQLWLFALYLYMYWGGTLWSVHETVPVTLSVSIFASIYMCFNVYAQFFSGTDSPKTFAKIPFDELKLCNVPYGLDNSAAFVLAERQRWSQNKLKTRWHPFTYWLWLWILSQTRKLDGLATHVINPKSEHF